MGEVLITDTLAVLVEKGKSIVDTAKGEIDEGNARKLISQIRLKATAVINGDYGNIPPVASEALEIANKIELVLPNKKNFLTKVVMGETENIGIDLGDGILKIDSIQKGEQQLYFNGRLTGKILYVTLIELDISPEKDNRHGKFFEMLGPKRILSQHSGIYFPIENISSNFAISRGQKTSLELRLKEIDREVLVERKGKIFIYHISDTYDFARDDYVEEYIRTRNSDCSDIGGIKEYDGAYSSNNS